ncbi:Mitochondrial import receptor subunit TOM40 [Characodon lateralis]|uniref:Mitochondrial import receptor subunit TOM40 n=1 Tax=Characodon lateralis TaxID=208331 RepID=A0ABU7DV97_9TELE|nr:Mitochondrial import receptor subunit TOM40 [Characodon lateralis]
MLTSTSGRIALWKPQLPPRMGSVLAASSPSPLPDASAASSASPGVTMPPGFGMPPVSPVVPPAGTGSGLQQEAEDTLPNPGTFDECHRKCKEVFPMQMEGVRLVVNKGLSNHFQVSV